MQSERLTVKCVTTNNCFVFLPDSLLRKLEIKEHVIELCHGDRKYYVSCNTTPNIEGKLFMSGSFARALGIKDGDEVFVSFVRDTPNLTSISVIPHDHSDREILELQMERIQSTLLNQIRVVAKNQPIVYWISKFCSITLTTDTLEPNFTYGKLEQFTEVYVKDADPSIKQKTPEKPSNLLTTVTSNLCKALNKLAIHDPNEAHADLISRNEEILKSYRNKCKPSVYRVHFLPKSQEDDNLNLYDDITQHPYNVFVRRSQIPDNANLVNGFATFKMKKVPRERDYVNTTSTNFLKKDDPSVIKLPTELTVRLFPLEDFLDKLPLASNRESFNLNSIHRDIYISESIAASLGLEINSKVILGYSEAREDSFLLAIEVFPCSSAITRQRFEDYLKKYTKKEGLLLNSEAALIFENGDACVIRITPRDRSFVIIKNEYVDKVIVVVKGTPKSIDFSKMTNLHKEHPRLERIALSHIKNILREINVALDFSLGLNTHLSFEYDRENILICGGTGSGKTTLCKILRDRLQNAPYFVYTHMIDCKSLKGKKVEVLQKLMATVMADCVYYQPSILFLDDIESITNAGTGDEENTPDAVNAARIVDMLVNTVRQYQESHYVSIIGTCSSVNRIGQKLRPARGAHFFRTILSIPNLEKADRIDILRLMLGDKSCVLGDVNWDYYGNKTEGWMLQDLVDVAEKATFAAWRRQEVSDSPVNIEEQDLAVVVKNFTPMSLEGIQLFKGSGHSWSDIGGLEEVKRSLVEILQWPLKYPEVFKKAPIKLQNGVLLYGMPGTGKTMLAKAIANECGVNLISVKGPELLSKYIGVSEESVRDVFERARRAKPCVLFFDEFDSLAPRRGHDSTGVTDRVVNQLLTQLDGVEDREGVAVVAASSRPDLLDPALLRPGRLDKSLYCPLPSEADRKDILLALCHSQNIETAELDLEELASLSSGFTGADLNAAVTQARLSAFEDAVAASPDGKVEPANINVTQQHLLDSVKSTHPSLSKPEKKKYERIYSRFCNGSSSIQDMKNQKATLA